jgi:hypothetical protein
MRRPPPGDPQRTVRFGQLAPASKGGDALAGEMAERFEKRRLAVITGMIVGHTERIESAGSTGSTRGSARKLAILLSSGSPVVAIGHSRLPMV